MPNKVIILDFGSQYTQLIARRVRELNIFCEIFPYNSKNYNLEKYSAVILSGSPYSVRSKDSLKINLENIKGKLPLLGICYGAQYLAHNFGGNVDLSSSREYGRANLVSISEKSALFDGVKNGSQVWMSHADTIVELPRKSIRIGSTKDVDNAAFKFNDENTFGIQFHPEVYHSEDGKLILENFLKKIAKIKATWTSNSFIDSAIENIRSEVKSDNVILGLSGGVDSSVAAVLLNKAIGNQLTCIFIDNGLLRKNEFESVLKQYKGMGLNVVGVDAKEKFYKELNGIIDPEKKRKCIGKVFIDVFDEESKKIENVKWLAQGTIYPDVIESAASKFGKAHVIKSHHNVGGLPERMSLKLVEPLRDLFKDEVRKIGIFLGLPESLVMRHPFPGPGLGVRILGEVKKEYADTLREADSIFLEELRNSGLYETVAQAFAVYLPVKSVGVVGDARRYEHVIALRAVETIDFMTARWARLPYEFIENVSNRIINEIEAVSRVVYDISSKPPATIEWE